MGAVVALTTVALCTLIVYPLKHVAPVASLSVVYLPAVLVVSITWGAPLGVGTAVVSALAFNFFHLPPVGELTIKDSRNWVALIAFLVVALIASSVAEVTRARAQDAQERRREADLAAEMARLLLRGNSLSQSLPTAAARLAQTLELNSAAIEMDTVEADDRTVVFPLREGTRRLGTLVVGADTSEASLRRLQERIVPSLEALLSAALEREGLLGGVVETAALRRADTVKTALLRAVSHDLRSPLTAISAAGAAVASPSLSPQEREEMAAVIQEEARRLSRLVDNLLDLSRLEAGAAEPRLEWVSLEEMIRAAIAELAAAPEAFSLSIDRDLPLVRLDAAQMERAFVNVFENARRHSGGHPVSVRARMVRSLAGARRERSGDGDGDEPAGAARARGDRVIVRVVDRGPGIPPAQLERVFEPFYRAGAPGGEHRGSGLGLAIARGFAEANSATLHVESLPGQGATFVFEFPLERSGDGRRGRFARRGRLRGRAARAGRSRRGRRAGCMNDVPEPPSSGKPPRVLVVDDEPQIVRALKVVLREAGFEAVPAETASEALDLAAVRPPEAAIVDLVLPDRDGVEVTRVLREWSEMPILVLSAVGEEEQKVRALEAGADDYITKPFGTRELVARLQAALRRAGVGESEPTIEVDGLEIDLAAHVVRRDGEPIHLTPIEFDLLRTLARNRGRLMTHRRLLEEVWGPQYVEDIQPLRTHIARLRAKIEPDERGTPRYIVTDPGIGYRFA